MIIRDSAKIQKGDVIEICMQGKWREMGTVRDVEMAQSEVSDGKLFGFPVRFRR